MQLRSAVAVAVAYASGYGSDLTLSLGTYVCRRCSPKNTKKERERGRKEGRTDPGDPVSDCSSTPSMSGDLSEELLHDAVFLIWVSESLVGFFLSVDDLQRFFNFCCTIK